MNFFERKERYKSGQNPTPTQEEFEKQMVKVGDKWCPIGIDWGKYVMDSSDVRRGQIKPAANKIIPKLKDDEVHELYNLLMKFAIRIQEEEK